MHIHKLKHCCMVISIPSAGGKHIIVVTDPGIYSLEEHDKIKHADIILITHEHADHFHVESLKALLKRAPDAEVITNDAVGLILAQEGIRHHVMSHGNNLEIKGIVLEAYGKTHAIMHSSMAPVSNVGFCIAGKLFYPGDSFVDPKRSIDVLALPVSGPWMKISEAIDYAIALKPRIAFPVHDAIRFGSAHALPEKILPQHGIEFIKLEEGGEFDVAHK